MASHQSGNSPPNWQVELPEQVRCAVLRNPDNGSAQSRSTDANAAGALVRSDPGCRVESEHVAGIANWSVCWDMLFGNREGVHLHGHRTQRLRGKGVSVENQCVLVGCLIIYVFFFPAGRYVP